MKTLARITCVVVPAALALGGIASPARAKGPTEVEVSGPGVDVRLTYTDPTDDIDSTTLGEASRINDMWDPAGLGAAPDLTDAELGPRYVLTWSGGEHGDAEDIVVQHAYPFADGGAWVEFLPDQELYSAPIADGWVRTPRLQEELVELGATVETDEPAVAEVEPVSATPEASASKVDAATSYDVAVAVGVALAVVLGAGGLVLWRRRISR